ncbi:MAG TPA: hypothetical protein VGN32_12225, partial [Ktedonobacterales bacterium]|nr:hypothetical protein [Ktedonobacterales bacterium]
MSVVPSGAYTLTSQRPAWVFGGQVGARLAGITTTSGSDALGAFQVTQFTYLDKSGVSRQGAIRAYTGQSIVVFTDTHVAAGSNIAPFPRLTSYPSNLYHLTYQYAFAQHTFAAFGSDSPWLFFDAQANAFMLSPASDFLVASTSRTKGGVISTGITPVITQLPQGFTHATMLVVGQGINSTMGTWGLAMTTLQGKVRTPNDADATLNMLGYWTDHGAAYYYTYDSSLGYAGTLLNVSDSFKQ